MMFISFIIPAYNEAKNIATCINSIQEECHRYMKEDDPLLDWEIIVVDNNSTDDTAINAEYAGAKVITEFKKGVTHARQAGFSIAKYPIHAYIDADNELPIGWVRNIESFYHDDIVAISGPLYFKNFSWIRRASTLGFYGVQKVLHHFFPTLQGGNYAVNAFALEEIGGHSTDYDFYGEDTDLAKRLSKVGNIKLSHKMWIYSSDRRFVNEGLFRTTWTYVINYFSVNLLNRPVTKTYKDYR
jgi:glycosyltransferase involved in cell wall biosynthesis